MLELPSVTLACVFTVAHDLTLLALNECLRHAKFGEVLLVTDRPIEMEGVRHIAIPQMSAAEFVKYNQLEFYNHIRTEHVLGFQWDGWILHPEAWTNEFLQYDYIGAPWPWHKKNRNVGNSGFSLRSRKLMEYLANHHDQFPWPEDETLCIKYRGQLEAQGFRWASETLAHQFSFECSKGKTPSFGFHSILNFPNVLRGPEYRQRKRMCEADPYVRNSCNFTNVRW